MGNLHLGVLGISVAQTVTIDPVGAVTIVERNNLTITCTDHGVNAGMISTSLKTVSI